MRPHQIALGVALAMLTTCGPMPQLALADEAAQPDYTQVVDEIEASNEQRGQESEQQLESLEAVRGQIELASDDAAKGLEEVSASLLALETEAQEREGRLQEQLDELKSAVKDSGLTEAQGAALEGAAVSLETLASREEVVQDLGPLVQLLMLLDGCLGVLIGYLAFRPFWRVMGG